MIYGTDGAIRSWKTTAGGLMVVVTDTDAYTVVPVYRLRSLLWRTTRSPRQRVDVIRWYECQRRPVFASSIVLDRPRSPFATPHSSPIRVSLVTGVMLQWWQK